MSPVPSSYSLAFQRIRQEVQEVRTLKRYPIDLSPRQLGQQVDAAIGRLPAQGALD
jgi:hypothetical protein